MITNLLYATGMAVVLLGLFIVLFRARPGTDVQSPAFNRWAERILRKTLPVGFALIVVGAGIEVLPFWL